MISRRAKPLVQDRLTRYPAAALLGPRQCGKTTLAKELGGHYFDLEVEADRLRIDLQWPDILAGDRLIILDEAQTWPELFPRLRAAIDHDRKRTGRFLLLGSVSPSLMKQVFESLAGRLSLIELSPFFIGELPDSKLDDLWLFGGYPDGGILTPSQFPQWQQDYLAILTQRDLPNWGLSAKPQVIQRLLRMVSLVHGQTWNASQIGQSLGLNYQTINGYMDYLTGSFLMRRLESYASNLRKRLVKSPKIYWRDSGLLHALLQVDSLDKLLSQPWVGASWEGFVVEQILIHLESEGKNVQPYFLRTSDQYEIDLILDFGNEQWAIEAKLTSNPSSGDLMRFNKTADLVQATKRILVSRTPETIKSKQLISTNLDGMLRLF